MPTVAFVINDSPFVIFITVASFLAPTKTCWVFNIHRNWVFLSCCTQVITCRAAMRYHQAEMTSAWVSFIRFSALVTGLVDLIKQIQVLQLTDLMPVVIMPFIHV